jgi:hypothetical protein
MRSRRGPGSFPSVPWPRRSREASRRKSRARTRSWASSTTASKSTSAPYQSTASIATIADAYAAGEQDVAAQVAVDELARDADRAPGGEETRHLGHALEAARSCSTHAMRSARAQPSVRPSSTAAGRSTAASARWNRSPTARMSAQRGAWAPASIGHAVQPSTTNSPSRERSGGATRKSSQATAPRTSACHRSASMDMSSGLSTRSPARHAVPWPPGSRSGRARTPNRARISAGGSGISGRPPAPAPPRDQGNEGRESVQIRCELGVFRGGWRTGSRGWAL